MFFTRGIQMVASLAALIAPENQGLSRREGNQSYNEIVSSLAKAVSGLSSNEQQQVEFETAINDVFHEPTTQVFSWLLGICSAYVGLCSLGLEHSCAAELKKLLARLDIVLDTDVAISLICEGEPDHDTVVTLAKRWRAMGAKIFIAEPVLFEIAHHAWIAERDHDQNRGWLPGSADDRLRLINNAFSRAFATLMANKGAKIGQWRRYIGMYRGANEHDSSRIFGILNSEYGIERLPPPTSDELQIEGRVREHLSEVASRTRGRQGDSLPIALDKAKRDAQIYASLVRHHRATTSSGQGRVTLLISSARRLLMIHEKIAAISEKELVIPLSVALYLLTLVPEVSIGLGAMRTYLFEGHQFGLGSILDRRAMSVIHEAQALDVPWAKRVVISREIRNRLFDDARKQGLTPENHDVQVEVERKALRPENAKRVAEIIVEAVNSAGVDTRLEQENRELRQKVRTLEEILERRRER